MRVNLKGQMGLTTNLKYKLNTRAPFQTFRVGYYAGKSAVYRFLILYFSPPPPPKNNTDVDQDKLEQKDMF